MKNLLAIISLVALTNCSPVVGSVGTARLQVVTGKYTQSDNYVDICHEKTGKTTNNIFSVQYLIKKKKLLKRFCCMTTSNKRHTQDYQVTNISTKY